MQTPAHSNLKFTTKDQLRCLAWTIAFGVLVIIDGHAEPRTQAVLIALGAGMSSLWVHLTIVRRELQRLLQERSPQSPGVGS